MASSPAYPAPGCVVEYLEDNEPRVAMTLEESNGRLRLLLPSRKEVKLGQNRVLPWLGPQYPANLSREEYVRILEERTASRKALTQEIDPIELWEMTRGEMDRAEAGFFAELLESDPEADKVAAVGRALLDCKTRFRFSPPFFAIFDAETVEKREKEQKAKAEKEALVSGGAAFLRFLWDVASRKKTYDSSLEPGAPLSARLEKLLRDRVINPDTLEDDSLWQMVSKSLPEVPHLPLQLLTAWGKLPRHHNFWLDRASYEVGDDWWKGSEEEVNRVADYCRSASDLPLIDKPFVSIDGASTRDIDDAFYIEETDEGWNVIVALANPALPWPFGDELDKKVLHRATSVYLPEGNLHMLPRILGEDAVSLVANETRPAFCLRMKIGKDGEISDFEPSIARARLSANLIYEDVQAALEGSESPDNPALQYRDQLLAADKMAKTRETYRVAHGAIIIRKTESKISLEDNAEDIIVHLEPEAPSYDASRIVGELMVAASAEFARWATENSLPVIFRTQNVTVPKEYAGIWDKPEDMARIMRSLAHSILETSPRPHAALGLSCYAPVTSPIRRYADLVNEAQAMHFIANGSPRWTEEELEKLLDSFSPDLEAASQAQRFRPRYWKLLYLKQLGEKAWLPAVITEENDNFVSVSALDGALFLRGKRGLFDERAFPGMNVRIRAGKVNPLYNESQILEVLPSE